MEYNLSPLTAVTDNGTSCRFSSRRCAVTTISAKPVSALALVSSSCAKAGVAAKLAHAMAIAAADVRVWRIGRMLQSPEMTNVLGRRIVLLKNRVRLYCDAAACSTNCQIVTTDLQALLH